ncbi:MULTISPECIES: ATP-dependent zinc protease family protein [Vibrio]|uniref:ATP-dependent Zn protease n=1 Tax=Vibrio bivalvicida TaxID=1276888 RepID=A0A177Y590_9VIBR|nr:MULTISPECIES: ATP-dependent zinc protease [Vibrio]KLN63121.1 ATP-dependent Zn protease [Vibrio sp. VPAP30]OAJ95937.1 ATP-dependent Zn protease [Vibrio bivalvicida]
MLTRFTPIVVMMLLSGCTLTNSEQYHQETLAAIKASEANLTNQYTNLNLQLNNQSDYVESLEEQVHELEQQLLAFKAETLEAVRKKPEPIVIPASTQTEPTPSHEIVLGEVEKVTIDSIKQSFDARVDTGAATSSLNAIDVEQFERNGKNWVRFHLSSSDTEPNDSSWIEAPIIRFVKIRQSTNEEVERRAVVELWVKLGKIHEKAQFTLADRSQMSHPVLLGREFIRDIAVVDVSKKYIHTEVPQK